MLLVVACFVAGVAVRRWWNRAGDAAALLDRLVLGVFLPALILRKVPRLPLGADAVVPVAGAWSAVVVGAGLVLVVSKLGRFDRRTTGTLLLVTPLANTSFLGIAAVRALLGERYLPPAIAYDQLGTFLALVTYGTFIAGRYGSGGEAPESVLRRLVSFPPFVALLASVPLRWFELPELVDDGLAGLSLLIGPAAGLALGLRFRLRVERAVLAPAIACLSIRMLVVPALALVAFALSDQSLAWSATVMEASMPPMITAGIVATAAGLDERLATFVIGTGILVSFATLPVVAALVT